MIHAVRIDAAHKYWVPRVTTDSPDLNVPGFSEICADLGISQPNPFYTDQGREEGIALHEWLGFLVRGKIPSSPPHPSIAGRVEGIKKFIKDSGFKIVGGEIPLYAPTDRYACTPDLWGYMGAWSFVIDAKRGSKLPLHKLQTAAQRIALQANGFTAQKRAALYLRDGDYRLDPHDDSADAPRWRTFVQSYHAKKAYL